MAATPTFQLLQLPLEVIIYILGKLPCVSLLRLSQCCRFLHTIIRETVSLQYKLSLWAINLVERVNLPQSNVRERLHELQRRETAWAGLRWRDRGIISLAPDSGVYELQQGIFIQGLRCIGAPTDMLSDGVRIVHLPRSTDANATECQPITEEYRLGFEFADFNIDPEQDLAVYACSEQLNNNSDATVNAYIRIRQLSRGGKAHPLARAERLELGRTFRHGLMFIIQIFGDFIGILNRSFAWAPEEFRDSEFFLYNWKTGTLQTRCKHAHAHGLIILSPYYFVLVSSEDPIGLHVYHFQPRRVVGLAPPPRLPRRIATYLLPNVHPLALGDRDLICRCEPTPVFEPPDYAVEGTPDAAGALSDTEEVTHPPLVAESHPVSSPAARPGQDDFRLAVLTFSIRRADVREQLLSFIAISELFKDAQKLNATAVDSAGRSFDDGERYHRVLEWDEWGPRWARLMQGTASRAWVCYVFMTRFVLVTSEPPMDAIVDGDIGLDDLHEKKGYISVLDFNPHGLHESFPACNGVWLRDLTDRQSNGHLDSSDDIQDSDKPMRQICRIFNPTRSIPVGDEIFATQITSHLPFRIFSSSQPVFGAGDPMIDDERILLLEDDDGSETRLRVLVF